MNAGFSNLYTLKQTLLTPAIAAGTSFDAAITAIGLGLAGRVEKLLNRKLARMVGWQEVFPADRGNFLLSRFPLEVNPSLVELKLDEVDGFVSQDITSSDPWWQTVDLANGMIIVPDDAEGAEYYGQVRITYTGGFFWEQLEPTDGGYPTTVPSTATLLPSDIIQAWLLTCQEVWSRRDKLGLSIKDKPGEQTALTELKFSTEVKEMLQPYIRYNMV